jgi:hypothetical protein
VKSDLQKIALSAASSDGLYFSTEVPVIFINKAKRKPICLGDFEDHIDTLPTDLHDADDQAILDHMCSSRLAFVTKALKHRQRRWRAPGEGQS